MSEDQIVYRERGKLNTPGALLNLLEIDATGLHSVVLEGGSRLIRSPHKRVDAVSTVQLFIGSASAAVRHARTRWLLTRYAYSAIEGYRRLRKSRKRKCRYRGALKFNRFRSGPLIRISEGRQRAAGPAHACR
jgi:hypothetical protein